MIMTTNNGIQESHISQIYTQIIDSINELLF